MLNFDPKNMGKMMKQLGVKTENMNPDEVIVKIGDKELVFEDPSLTKMKVKGEEMFQLQGRYEKKESINQEDVELVMEKADVSEKEAKEALKENEDMTEAIMSLKS